MSEQAQQTKQSGVILETRNLTKDFKGFTAVKDVNLQVETGSIHAIIGPNGAGKTTFFNLLTKFLKPSAGEIIYDGRDITHSRPAGKTTFFNLLTKFLKPSAGEIIYDGRDITHSRPAGIAQHGLVRSFQISAVFPHLTARDNVRIALQRKLGVSYHFWRPTKILEQLNEEAQETLEQVGLQDFGDIKAVELPYGQKRALEIATTIALKPKLMLLDEPTQGMSSEDVGTVTDLIRRVVEGRTIVMVEHNLNVVSSLADKITVLSRGEILAEGDYETVSTNPAVMEAYMGTTDAA